MAQSLGFASCIFTPACYYGLDGMPFPALPHSFPTKDEMANYLKNYACLSLDCRFIEADFPEL
jgi:hypothetical protein